MKLRRMLPGQDHVRRITPAANAPYEGGSARRVATNGRKLTAQRVTAPDPSGHRDVQARNSAAAELRPSTQQAGQSLVTLGWARVSATSAPSRTPAEQQVYQDFVYVGEGCG